jgi:hypothetical protein
LDWKLKGVSDTSLQWKGERVVSTGQRLGGEGSECQYKRFRYKHSEADDMNFKNLNEGLEKSK